MKEERLFNPMKPMPPGKSGGDLLILESDGDLYVREEGSTIRFPFRDETAATGPDDGTYLGVLHGHHCFVTGAVDSPGLTRIPARAALSRMDDGTLQAALRGLHLRNWIGRSRYCGRCGSPMTDRPEEGARHCRSCGLMDYPRISPAVILSVIRGDSILLASAPRFRSSMYSVLAGFVEAGESLEDCARREVFEETGIVIRNLKYFGSQPWPFPDSLMIAFTSEYDCGEIRIDTDEILDARWFRAGELPPIPGPPSIARRIIDSFISGSTGQPCREETI